MRETNLRGPWSIDRIERYLDDARIPLRLACNGPSRFPVIASHWFVRRGSSIYCAVQCDSHVASLLTANPHCAFEISSQDPPYRGVRGQALATLDDSSGAEILELLIDRYLSPGRADFAKWLRSRSDTETAVRLDPTRLSSWDYAPRMGTAA